MPNVEKMRATQALVESNLKRWNQIGWVTGEVNPNAETVNECGASFCWFGWAAVAEGYRPTFDDLGGPYPVFHNPETGDTDHVEDIVANAHELTGEESKAISNFMTTDIAEMRDRVESVIRGEWR